MAKLKEESPQRQDSPRHFPAQNQGKTPPPPFPLRDYIKYAKVKPHKASLKAREPLGDRKPWCPALSIAITNPARGLFLASKLIGVSQTVLQSIKKD